MQQYHTMEIILLIFNKRKH